MLEVDLSGLPDGFAPILSFESKTDPGSPYWRDIRFKPAALPEKRKQELLKRCRVLFRRLGLRDCGRFDFRTAVDGTIKLMEVNPNPAWGFDAKLNSRRHQWALSRTRLPLRHSRLPAEM